MPTVFITHPVCSEHEMGPAHPEQPARLAAITAELQVEGLWERLDHRTAPRVDEGALLRVHSHAYLEEVRASVPNEGYVQLDPDTAMNPHSFEAAQRAAGALVHAVDEVMAGTAVNAFCAVRPPGHHAERRRAMGFCIFNNVAVGAAHALAAHGLERVAILDFDVHHGNGTENIFADDPRVLLCSSFQHPHYPYSGDESRSDHIVYLPLAAGSDGGVYRRRFSSTLLPALEQFRPQMLLISAGFDGHRLDPLAGLALDEEDYAWITEQAVEIAQRHCQGRIISTLEGGYHLEALGRSVAAHIRVLLAAS